MKKLLIFFLCLSIIPIFGGKASAESILTVDMHYVVIAPTEDGSGSTIKHTVNYSNSTDAEFKGDGSSDAVINIHLPAGASNLQVHDESLGIQTTETGFYTTKAVPAKGSITVQYSYQVPAGVPINFLHDYSLQVMQILIPEGQGSLEVEGATATNAGLMQFENQNFWLYNVEGIQAEKPVKVVHNKDVQPTVDNTQANSGESTEQTSEQNAQMGNVTRTDPGFHNPGHIRMWDQSPLRKFDPHILMIVLGAILIAGVGYYSYFRWKAHQEDLRVGADKEENAFKQLLARQNAIMDKIMELEDTYVKGQIEESEYTTKLNAYKQHLVQVKVSLRKFVE